MEKFESKLQNCFIDANDRQLFRGWADAQVIVNGVTVYRGDVILASLDGYVIVPRSKYPGGDPCVTKTES